MSEYPIAGLMPWDILNATKSWKRNTVTITIERSDAIEWLADHDNFKRGIAEVRLARILREHLEGEEA